MKKVMVLVSRFIVFLGIVLIFADCSSMGQVVHYRMDDLVPFEYPQSIQNEDERLVYIAPFLMANHWFSNLYIITNPEDIYAASEKFVDQETMPLKTIENTLKEFSAVKVQSTTDQNIGNGVAIFSLPPFVDEFFYVYIRYLSDVKYKSDYTTEVWSGILSLPSGSNDVYIEFAEWDDELNISATMNPVEMKEIYDDSTGMFGWQLAQNKEQIGFIPIGLKERYVLAEENRTARELAAREEAIAAGATFSVYSNYVTYQQETRTYQYGDIGARGAGVFGTGNADEPIRFETVTQTVDVPVRHELAFELYKGNTRVFNGTTPVTVTGIDLDTEYTLRWVSPNYGNSEYRFKMGLTKYGVPGDGRKYIE